MAEAKLFLKKASATPTPGIPIAVSASGLPADLLNEASKRLGWVGLLYSTVFTLAYFGPHTFWALAAPSGIVVPGFFSPEMAIQTTVAMVSIAVGLTVFALSRAHRMKAELLLDIGLVFEVLGAFGISMSTWWGSYPEWSSVYLEQSFGVPWEGVWIIIFPLLAPNTPRKTLIASLAAASTGLVTLTLSQAAGQTSPDLPFPVFAIFFLFTTYLCAGIAYAVSCVVYRLGRKLKRAQEIGSYQLIRRLGAGGMGEVWLARHRMLARPAAIKLIRPETLGEDDIGRTTMLRRFEREAQATAALRSYHTVELYDFGATQSGSFYYVMELLNGLNLQELVERFGPLPAARTIYLLRQACHSLGEAHEVGLVHRDVKPANIYTCRLGPDHDFVKVLDFGLVKRSAEGKAGELDLTAEGVATGTPAFMPPELALGKGAIDGRADIYGLGCVAYWLLTGHRVFEEDSPLATVVAHIQEPPIPPSQRTEIEIPQALERVILACLEKEPANRPQTAMKLDSLLAASDSAGDWGEQQAREWWSLHMPDSDSAPWGGDVEVFTPAEILTVQR